MLPSIINVSAPAWVYALSLHDALPILVKMVANTRLPYGSISRHREPPGLVRADTSKKKRSPAAAVKRYRSVSLAGARVPLTGVPGVSAVARATSHRRKA